MRHVDIQPDELSLGVEEAEGKVARVISHAKRARPLRSLRDRERRQLLIDRGGLAVSNRRPRAHRRVHPHDERVVRVRILDPQEATAATTRVMIESTDGHSRWATVGVSDNIIEASWEALVDSVEYKIFQSNNGS